MHLVCFAVTAVCTGGCGAALLPAGVGVAWTSRISRLLRAVLLLLPLLQLCQLSLQNDWPCQCWLCGPFSRSAPSRRQG